MTATEKNKSTAVSNDEIDLRHLIGTLLDGKWIIVGFTMVFAIVGVAIALLSTPIYRADSLLQIEEKSGGASALTGALGELFPGDSSATTEIEVLKSRMVVGRTVDELGLTNIASPQYFPIVGRGLNRLFGAPREISIGNFGVEERLLGKTLELEVTSSDTYQVRDSDGVVVLEGKVGELATGEGVTLNVTSLSAAEGDQFSLKKEYWLEVVTDLQTQLSVAERGKDSGILSIALEGDNPDRVRAILESIVNNYESQNIAREAAQAEQSLRFLEEQLPDIRERLRIAEDDLNEYRQERESVDLSREAEALLTTIVELEGRINDLNMEEAEVAQRFTQQHPAYKTLIENRRMLEVQREELDARIRELPETQRDILRRNRELSVNQEVYTTLLNRVQELTVVKAGTVGYVRILDSAQTALKPVKPKKPLIAVLATMLGGMLGTAFVLVRSFLNPGILSTDGVEDMGLPVFGSIPVSIDQIDETSRRRGTVVQKPLALRNPADLAMEAIRSLRTSIHFAMMDSPNNVVMISGAAPRAGKSFLSTNLALTLGSSNQKVLLIDADMRRGHLHRTIGLDRDPGLSSYLQGINEIDEVVKPSEEGGISFIAAGKAPPNPAELLMHSRFDELLEWAAKEFDVVVVDTPPILAVTDAAIIAKRSGVKLLIGRYGEISLKEVEASFDRFDKAGVKMTAFVLNAVERSKRSSYYYQYDYGTDNS
jgi:tyrosine-protein kinase Etk/Wzc